MEGFLNCLVVQGYKWYGKRGCMYGCCGGREWCIKGFVKEKGVCMYGRCGLWEEPVSSCGSANQGWETTRPRSEVILAADKNYDEARRVNHHVQPLI